MYSGENSPPKMSRHFKVYVYKFSLTWNTDSQPIKKSDDPVFLFEVKKFSIYLAG